MPPCLATFWLCRCVAWVYLPPFCRTHTTFAHRSTFIHRTRLPHATHLAALPRTATRLRLVYLPSATATYRSALPAFTVQLAGTCSYQPYTRYGRGRDKAGGTLPFHSYGDALLEPTVYSS